MFWRVVLGALVVTVTSGCSYGKRVSAAEGKTVKAVVQRWGLPTSVDTKSGYQVYTYKKSRLHWGQLLECTTTFNFRNNRVESSSFYGNGCGKNLDRKDTSYAQWQARQAANRQMLQGAAEAVQNSNQSRQRAYENSRQSAPAAPSYNTYSAPSPQSYEAPPVTETCFHQGEEITGLGKICYYKCVTRRHATNVNSYDICPVTMQIPTM